LSAETINKIVEWVAAHLLDSAAKKFIKTKKNHSEHYRNSTKRWLEPDEMIENP